ncbi:hypothetical protein ACI7RC_23690 [Brevibacillus sp. B_LB10_24]|uniref:hypothetical protein n=1 Tax=Brevibacillus sp. B_LB10_24 TaxID=3380645 RepID=UPI0038BAC082
MKYLFVVFLLFMTFVTGCQGNELSAGPAENHQPKSLQEAVQESGVPNILHTVERDQYAFSFAHSQEDSKQDLKLLHFFHDEEGWHYQGNSGFGVADAVPVTYGAATWITNKYQAQGENTYASVHLGQVLDTNIEKVVLTLGQKTHEAKLVNEDGFTLWYVAIDDSGEGDQHGSVAAYGRDGELIFQSPSAQSNKL